jgi:hypothetical protein
MQITQAATSGTGAGINVVSNNTSAPAIRARAAGPLLRLHKANNDLVFEVDNTGAITTSAGATFTSLTTTDDMTVGDTLTVTGTSTLTGQVTLTGGINGSATLHGGNLTIDGTTKAYRFRQDGGGLDLEASGADLVVSNWSGAGFTGTQRSYLRFSADAQNLQIAGKVEFADGLYGNAKHVLDGTANTIGFFGTAAAAKQTVSGSRGGNAALASLLTALATYGIVTDSSSA